MDGNRAIQNLFLRIQSRKSTLIVSILKNEPISAKRQIESSSFTENVHVIWVAGI